MVVTLSKLRSAEPPVSERIDGVAIPGSASATSATPTARFLDRPGGRIAYDLTGDAGPLVICVPSMGDVRREYRFLVPQLVAAGFRVATMDVRGHGESSVGWDDHSAAAVGSDIVALARALQSGPAIVIGTSMAAGAAVWAAAEAPDRIAGQILVGPFVRSETVGSTPSKARAQALLIKVLFAGPWAVASWGIYYQSLYKSARPADLAIYRAALQANLREPGRMDALRAMLATKNDNAGRLGAVRGRSLVIMGSADPDFPDPAGEARWLAAQLGGGTPLLIDGAGHYPHAERPDEVGKAIVEWLKNES